jgi:hypothetical protein
MYLAGDAAVPGFGGIVRPMLFLSKGGCEYLGLLKMLRTRDCGGDGVMLSIVRHHRVSHV